jgi:hypothetical protein
VVEQQELDLNSGTGATNLETSDVSSPQLPADGGMLNLQPGSYLRLREWREDKINLIGATQSITVRVPYKKILPLLVLGTGPAQIRSATDASGSATAALAARSRGDRALAADLLGSAQTTAET